MFYLLRVLRHTSSQGGGDVLARFSPTPGLDLAMGGELSGDFLHSNSLGDRTEGRGAAFGEAVLTLGGGGVVSLGIREDWHEEFGSFLSPSFSGSYTFGQSLRFRAAVGRSFRAPTFTERYYQDPVNQGRDDLAPERAWSGEVGADLFRGGDFRFSWTLFARRAEDLIDWARGVDAGEETPWETRNVEEATFRGMEGELEIRGPLGAALTFGGTLLSVDSKESRGFRSKYALRPLQERFIGKLYRAFGEGFAISLHAQRNRRAGEGPYYRIDTRTALRVGSTWLYLDGTNLTDQHYPDITGAPAPGRALRLGVELGPGR